MNYEVLLYYSYSPIEDVAAYVERHRALCESLGLLGRVIVAAEGINGTVSGLAEDTAAYRCEMGSRPETKAMDFKVSRSEGHAFKKLSVKARSELVTLGLAEGDDIDPNEVTGRHLSPEEFFAAMQDHDVLILDGRNNYESDIGRFRGAVCPDVEHFRDFPNWIRENLGSQKHRPVLTYCTGGIRCEKLSGFLVEEGFTNVSQLEGGIVTYGQDPAVQGKDFEGACYVFDSRIKVDVNSANPTVVSHCVYCGEPCDRYRNCGLPSCNAQFICCNDCEGARGRYCGPPCREEQMAAGGSEGRAAP